MKVYFDGVLINEDYYTQLSSSKLLFNDDDTFALGSTVCNSITLGIDKRQVNSIPSSVELKDNDQTYGVYVVDKVEENDFELVFTLTDKMINFNFNYDAKGLIENSEHIRPNGQKYVLLSEILQDMCDKANVELATSTFLGSTKEINWYDSTITAREYLSYIAELNGGYAIINKEGKLELKQFTNNVSTRINIDECENFTIGEYYKVSRVYYDNGIGTYAPVGDESANTLYINENNVYITSQQDVQNIYDLLNGLEFYSFTTDNCPIDGQVEAGSCIEFYNDENSYKTFAQHKLDYNGVWIGGYDLKVKSTKQEETSIIEGSNINKSVRKLGTTVDRLNNKIELLAEEVVPLSNDVTGTHSIQLENAYEGQLHNLEITGDISLLFANSNPNLWGHSVMVSDDSVIGNNLVVSSGIPKEHGILYPSSDLYLRSTTLIVDDQEYVLDFDFLNYISPNVCDKYVYKDGKQWIERNVGINEQGIMYQLPQTVIEKRKDISIMVKNNSVITLKSFNNAMIKVSYLLQNEYTDSFATNVDLKASIKVVSDNINLKVSKNDVINQINISDEDVQINASKLAKITADKIDLTGKEIDLTGENINIKSDKFNVDKEGNMECNNAIINGGNIELNGDNTLSKFKITFPNGTYQSTFFPNRMEIRENNQVLVSLGSIMKDSSSLTLSDTSGNSLYLTPTTTITTSLEENKKNIELFCGALEEVKNTDIYKYHYNGEKDDRKKHVGFVIGQKYNYSNNITGIDETGKEIGADLYSMISVLWQGVREQQQIIEELKEEINKLKESDN